MKAAAGYCYVMRTILQGRRRGRFRRGPRRLATNRATVADYGLYGGLLALAISGGATLAGIDLPAILQNLHQTVSTFVA